MASELNQKMKNIPKVDQVLSSPLLSDILEKTSREVVVDTVRKIIDDIRKRLLAGEDFEFSVESVASLAANQLKTSNLHSLRRVINGTGVILHTNLGRARLSDSAAETAASIAMGYSTLEYDLQTGKRGSRHDHINKLICSVIGAEDAIAVNNNAAATLLCLSSMAKNKEVLVSRGELVEIGGSFRIPDIMALSGAILKEIGTTNKTHLYDYENNFNEKTGAVLKVHTSNYRIMGFTEDVGCKELVNFAHSKNLPMIYDIGSGLLVDLHQQGLDEPTVPKALKDGADVVLFSGDKLLGGPQAGIIAGKKCYIEAMKKHPLARVLRLDKMTLAALEETFRQYRNFEEACKQIPVLAMITAKKQDVQQKAQQFALRLSMNNAEADFGVVSGIGRVGGGSAPMLNLDTYSVYVKPKSMTVDALAEKLRNWKVPIIAHIQEDKLLLDMRTIMQDELFTLEKALEDVL